MKQSIDESFIDRVILGYCGALNGARVRLTAPDGYSLPMGGGDGYDFEKWAMARVEEGVEAYAQSPSVRKAALRLIVQTYWESVPMDAHGELYGPICARSISAVRSYIWKACEKSPLPEFLAGR